MPTTSDEAWRRTSLRKVKWPKFHLNGSVHSISSNGASLKLTDLPEDVQYSLDANREAAGTIGYRQ